MVCRRGGNGPWGAPSMITVGGANVGFELGGQATDFVLLVMNGRGAEKLLHDSTKIGADASAAGGPVGRDAAGRHGPATPRGDPHLFARARRLCRCFAGRADVQAGGDSNEKLYGRKLAPEDILFKGVVPAPAAAQPLDTALTQFSPHGGEAVPTE